MTNLGSERGGCDGHTLKPMNQLGHGRPELPPRVERDLAARCPAAATPHFRWGCSISGRSLNENTRTITANRVATWLV